MFGAEAYWIRFVGRSLYSVQLQLSATHWTGRCVLEPVVSVHRMEWMIAWECFGAIFCRTMTDLDTFALGSSLHPQHTFFYLQPLSTGRNTFQMSHQCRGRKSTKGRR